MYKNIVIIIIMIIVITENKSIVVTRITLLFLSQYLYNFVS